MILPDWHIRKAVEAGVIGIDPFNPDNVQPASVDLRLSPSLCREDGEEMFFSRYDLEAGGFALGSTLERVRVPDDLVCVVNGKSTIARMGLAVHITAGFCDPGFDGEITLELHNVASRPFVLWAGMKICQISFMQMAAPAERPYGSEGLGSKYQNQRGPTSAR